MNLFEVEDCPPEYTRVRVAGVFDYPKTVFVGPRARTVMGKAEKVGRESRQSAWV